MPPRIRLSFAALSVTLFSLVATPLYRELSMPKDIWWTPRGMLVAFAQSQDRVEIYVRGKPLGALLEAGQLGIVDKRGSSGVATGEVAFRFNNWDRVRAEHLPMMLGFAATGGAMVMLFILVVTGRLAYRGESESVAP